MSFDIFSILAIDGLETGSIYVLIALGLVLIFAVTRVIFVPFGDIAAFTSLSLAALQTRHVPGTVWLVVVLAVVASAMEVIGLIAGGRRAAVPRALGLFLVLPCLAAGLVWLVAGLGLPMAVQAVLAVVVVLPVAPLLDRVVFRPVADGSVLLLLMMSVVLHFALAGVGLMFFGPEGVRTDRMTDYVADFGPVSVSGQMMLIAAAAALFSLLLYLFFDFTVTGKALRATAVNRTGARLVGIRPERAGTIAYLVGSLMAGVAGVLIAPVDTMFYDSGFLLGLLAFVGATIGGLANYPGTAAGALLIGLLGSFASFYSSAFKEVLVFSVLIPVLIWRSVAAGPSEEEPEE